MIPALAPGEFVLVKYGAKFKVGDVVLVEFVDRTDIKRVKLITPDHVLIEGDNAAVSIDSRHYGAVRINRVLGKVLFRLPSLFKKN